MVEVAAAYFLARHGKTHLQLPASWQIWCAHCAVEVAAQRRRVTDCISCS